jgi:hypothetical protein
MLLTFDLRQAITMKIGKHPAKSRCVPDKVDSRHTVMPRIGLICRRNGIYIYIYVCIYIYI